LKVSSADQSSGSVILGDGSSANFHVGIARWNGATNAAGAGGVGYFAQGPTNAGGHFFYTGDASAGSTTERMRIDLSGDLRLGVGGSGPQGPKFYGGDPSTGNNGLSIWPEGDGATSVKQAFYVNNTAARIIVRFINPNGVVGAINTSGSSTSYATSSDYRLKTDAQPMTGASARVQALNPVNFEWISDGSRVDGFLAHEAQAIVPEAVTGTKDAMMDEEYQVSAATGDIYTRATDAYVDEDDNAVDAVDEVIHSANAEKPETLEDGQQWRETTAAVMGTRSVPDMQGIDQSKMVPLLVASLQEALTEIAALKVRITALEGA
jgi:hypothetical protein